MFLGCKFLTKDFEIIPKKTNQQLINIDDIQTPRFSYRELFISESDNVEFATKCRLNGKLGHRSADEYQDEDFPKGREFITSLSLLSLSQIQDMSVMDNMIFRKMK